MARHGGGPVGSAARDATASPYVGLHRAQAREHCCTHPGTGLCMCDCHPDCDCPQTGSVMRTGWLTMHDDDVRRLQAAGMIWDENRQDWIPDPAIWGEPDDPPRCTSCGHLEADECGCRCCTWTCDERPADV